MSLRQQIVKAMDDSDETLFGISKGSDYPTACCTDFITAVETYG